VATERIDSELAFAERLAAVVTEAAVAGIDVRGAWPILNEDATLPDWDLEIVELAPTDQ